MKQRRQIAPFSLTESPAFTVHMLAFTTTSQITSWRRVCAADRRSNSEVSGFKAANKQPAASALVFQEEKTETLLKITLKVKCAD